MSTTTITKGDTRHVWKDLYQPDGTAVDVSGWTIKLRIKNQATGVTVERTASVDTDRTGGVKYAPTSDDVSTAGTFELQWKLTDADGKVDSIPNDDVITLVQIVGVPAATT